MHENAPNAAWTVTTLLQHFASHPGLVQTGPTRGRGGIHSGTPATTRDWLAFGNLNCKRAFSRHLQTLAQWILDWQAILP